MKVMPIKLPPLPCKNITVSLKSPEQVATNNHHERKYSVQHL